MSHAYRAVGWNRQKQLYDTALVVGVVSYLTAFIVIGFLLFPNSTPETLIIRAAGTCAFLMLHIILATGPLCRLCPRFLPLLYNRRHFGVSMCVVALIHGVFSVIQFHGFGDLNPLVSLLTTPGSYEGINDFPFQSLGFFALLILLIMAATSHDFWLANLTAPVWKALHMFVYLAYAMLVMHVALGVLQSVTDIVYSLLLGAGVVSVLGLHVWVGFSGRSLDKEHEKGDIIASDVFIETFHVDDIRENRARIITLGAERVAIFKYEGKVSAVSNVCQHQNGPLGEGKIIGGCITCPWHGYQYSPIDGASPPPFTEKIPVFQVQVRNGIVWLDPRPMPAGTHVEPALI